MAKITLNLPDDLALRLNKFNEELPEILELGLREFNANSQIGFKGSAEVLEFLASLPTPEAIISLKANKEIQREIDSLLEKNRLGNLTSTEEKLWEKYEYLEHLIRMAKAKAFLKLKEKQQ